MTTEEKNKQINSIDDEIKRLQEEKRNIVQAYNDERAKYLDMYGAQLEIGDTVIIAANNTPHKGKIIRLWSGSYGNYGRCDVEYEILPMHSTEAEKIIIKRKIDRWTEETIKIG